MPFPTIDPHWDRGTVYRLAEDYCRKISEHDPIVRAVHIMGELTFTHILVNMLTAASIPCIASTTERLVTSNPDGSKTSVFRFVAFRLY